jgi:hypothetical protein
MDLSKQQQAMDEVMACLHLFYVLLLIHIRFPGHLIDLAQRGQPQVALKPLAPDAPARDPPTTVPDTPK